MTRHRATRGVALVVAVILTGGCWYHRVELASPVTKGTDYESVTVWSFAWGSWQKDLVPGNCNGEGLAEVKTSSNVAFALVAVVTLGLVAPERVSWRCAKPKVVECPISEAAP